MWLFNKATLHNNQIGSAEGSNSYDGTIEGGKEAVFKRPDQSSEVCGAELWDVTSLITSVSHSSSCWRASPRKKKEKICEWIDWNKMPPGFKANPQKTCELWTFELPKIVQSMNRDWTDQCAAERRRCVTSRHLPSYTNPPPAGRISTPSPSIVIQRESHTLKLTGLVEQTGISWHS